MRSISKVLSASVVAILLVCLPANAATQPKNATAQCKDGTFSSAKTKKGACSKHGGVATWLADAPAAVPASTPAATPAPTPASAPVTTATVAKTTRTRKTTQVQTPPPALAPTTPSAQPPVSTNPTPSPVPKATRSAGNPQNATAKCRDGSFSYATHHSGACSHHGGVAEWYR